MKKGDLLKIGDRVDYSTMICECVKAPMVLETKTAAVLKLKYNFTEYQGYNIDENFYMTYRHIVKNNYGIISIQEFKELYPEELL